MKIAFISNPNSTHTRRWVNWFARRGHDVITIADTLLDEPWEYVELYNLPARFNLPAVKYLVWTVQTRQILDTWQPDILHAHRVTAAGWMGAFCGFSPFVVTPWGSDLYTYPHRSYFSAWLTRKVLQRADLVTVDSLDLRRAAIQHGAGPKLVELVQWGVDRSRFFPTSQPQALKKKWGLENKIVIYSPRNMTPLYNLEHIVQALQQVVQTYPECVLILRDLNADAGYRGKLLQQIKSLSLERHVRLVPRLAWEDTPALYQIADLVVSVPSSDGTPVSVLEAMACGVPVIASDLPSLREWIQPGENGLLTPVGDATSLASAMCTLLADQTSARRFREFNLHLVASRADHESEMQKMEKLYAGCLKGTR